MILAADLLACSRPSRAHAPPWALLLPPFFDARVTRLGSRSHGAQAHSLASNRQCRTPAHTSQFTRALSHNDHHATRQGPPPPSRLWNALRPNALLLNGTSLPQRRHIIQIDRLSCNALARLRHRHVCATGTSAPLARRQLIQLSCLWWHCARFSQVFLRASFWASGALVVHRRCRPNHVRRRRVQVTMLAGHGMYRNLTGATLTVQIDTGGVA